MDTEWIEHHGKGYPDLPMDTLVQVRFADGFIRHDANPVHKWSICWKWCEESQPETVDITHYRVVTK